MFSAARLLRNCSNPPYIYIIARSIGEDLEKDNQRWTNDAISASNMDNKIDYLKEGCLLDDKYAAIIVDCPKLYVIENILR